MNPNPERSSIMATIDFVEYEDANPEVRQVYDDIMAMILNIIKYQ